MQAVIRFYREARRRKVFRTGGLYLVGAWALLQAAALSFPGFGIPDAAIGAAIWAAVLGFPVALAFGWLFEVGPGGIRRTTPAEAGELAEPQPLARRDYLILGAFVAIAGVLVVRAVQEIRETPVADSSRPTAQDAHMLAWSYLNTGAEAKAAPLLAAAGATAAPTGPEAGFGTARESFAVPKWSCCAGILRPHSRASSRQSTPAGGSTTFGNTIPSGHGLQPGPGTGR